MNKRGFSFIIIALAVLAVLVIGYAVYSNYKTPSVETDVPSTDNSGTTTPGSTGVSGSTTPPSSGESSGSGSSSGSSEGSDGSSGGSGSTTPPETGASGPAAVNLGTAGDFAILSKAGISTTGTTHITGDIGVSPIDSTAITGFSQTMDSSNTFSTSDYVTGKLYAADYSPPTPSKMTTAVSDMETAYTDAAGRTNPTATELYAGDLSGRTLTPGLYKWGTGVLINNGVTLSCQDANDVFIFQISQELTVGNGAAVTLSGGCQAKNIFWQVAGQATLGTTSDFKGNILSATLIDMQTGAILNGRALAQTAVTLDANTITKSS